MPTFVLCMSTRARRSLLERLPRKSFTNLLAYLRLSPQPPHCHALRFSRSGASSHVQRSIRPALQALAIAWVRPAEEMAYKKAVSLNPGKAHWRVTNERQKNRECSKELQSCVHQNLSACSFNSIFRHRAVKCIDVSVVFLSVQYWRDTRCVFRVQKGKEKPIPLFNMLARWRPSKVQFHLSKRN